MTARKTLGRDGVMIMRWRGLHKSNSKNEVVCNSVKMWIAGIYIPWVSLSKGVAGTLSPAAVSPYVLAGDGSYRDTCFTRDAEASFSKEGTATLEECLFVPSECLFGVAGD